MLHLPNWLTSNQYVLPGIERAKLRGRQSGRCKRGSQILRRGFPGFIGQLKGPPMHRHTQP
jgi:hypothetical protein